MGQLLDVHTYKLHYALQLVQVMMLGTHLPSVCSSVYCCKRDLYADGHIMVCCVRSRFFCYVCAWLKGGRHGDRFERQGGVAHLMHCLLSGDFATPATAGGQRTKLLPCSQS